MYQAFMHTFQFYKEKTGLVKLQRVTCKEPYKGISKAIFANLKTSIFDTRIDKHNEILLQAPGAATGGRKSALKT
jgi:hypothetical protein